MPDLHVNPVTVPLPVVGEANLWYSVEMKRNKFVCCEETATKVLNERLSSSDEMSGDNELSGKSQKCKKLRKRIKMVKSVKTPYNDSDERIIVESNEVKILYHTDLKTNHRMVCK